jgi:hypothetical protein
VHSEGEERSRLLLKKAFDARAAGGTIAIAEILVDDDRTAPLPALIFAVKMLVNSDKATLSRSAKSPRGCRPQVLMMFAQWKHQDWRLY